MTREADLSFSSPEARRQYRWLMRLFRVAPVNRYLFGIFTRALARRFDPDNRVVLTLESGGRFPIRLNDAYWTRFALYHDRYEPEVAQVLRAAAGHTDIFCDLGANKGYWTAYASTLFQRIIAVEAASGTFEELSENTGGLANVQLHRAAVHARSHEQMSFIAPRLSHASARLGDAAEAESGDRTETVGTICADDLIEPGQPALIKLDVEGAEVAAIDGAVRTLSEGSVLIYEDHGADTACRPSAHLLKQPDFRLYSISKQPEQLCSVADVVRHKPDRFTGYNFLAARADSPLLAAILKGFANG